MYSKLPFHRVTADEYFHEGASASIPRIGNGEQENGAAGTEDLPTSLGRKSHGNIWTEQKEYESEYKQLLENLRKEGSVLNSVTLMLTIKAYLDSKASSLLKENGCTFDGSRTWVRGYGCSSMRWSFSSSTTAPQKLSSDWEEKGREKTYTMKGSREVAVTGKDDKLQDAPQSCNRDVILQRPFKAGFQREYAAWAVKSLTQQMSMDEMPRDNRSDLSIHLLRNNACEFLWKVHKQ
ncbi:hypothetical protein R1sor_001203 [Riccia sorocarpa]|uniref:Uncharacterized protein n=1 Tax=Riccia sorocarpa TaxID=122646 RepID=A0ABD3GWY7_9MARC